MRFLLALSLLFAISVSTVSADPPAAESMLHIPRNVDNALVPKFTEMVKPLISEFSADRVVMIEIVGVPNNASVEPKMKSLGSVLHAAKVQKHMVEKDRWVSIYLAVAPVDDLQAAAKSINKFGNIGPVEYVDSERRVIRVAAEESQFKGSLVKGKTAAQPKAKTSRRGTPVAAPAEVPGAETGPVSVALADGMKQIALPQKELDLVAIPGSGVVAAVDPARPGVRFYPKLLIDGSPNGVIERPAGDKPCSIVHKPLPGGKGVVLVLCAGDRTVHLFDDVKFESVNVVKLDSEMPIKLAASSSPTDRVAYYAAGGNKSGVAHFSLDTFKDLGMIDNAEDDNDLAVSADGSIVYTRHVGSSPTGINVYAIAQPAAPGQPVRVSRLADHHHSANSYLPDPFNQYVSAGDMLYPADIPNEKSLMKLPGVPLLFLREKPILLADNMGAVSIISMNTLQPIGKIDIPIQLASPAISGSDGPKYDTFNLGRTILKYEGHILADERRGNLLAWRGSDGVFMPIAALKIPEEPNLAIDFDGSREILIGQPLALTVKTRDKAAKLSLVDAPTGMAIANGKITWKPDANQVGVYSAAIRIASGSVQRECKFNVRVGRPTIQLDFEPNELVVSPSGKLLLAARTEAGVNRGPRGQKLGKDTAGRLVLIDLTTMKITADRTLDTPVQLLALDNALVYASLRDSNAFFVLSGKDLSDVKRVFTKERIQTFQPIADKMLFVKMNQYQSSVLSVPAFEPVEGFWQTREERNAFANGMDFMNPMALPDGWIFDGVIYDAKFEKAKLLVQPIGFPAMMGVTAPNADRLFAMREWQTQLGKWGNAPGGRRQMPNIGSSTWTVLTDRPAFVSLDPPDMSGSKDSGNVKWSLTTYDLMTAAPVGSQAIVGMSRPAAMNHSSYGKKIVAGNGVVIAQIGQTLYPVPTSDLPPPKTVPLTFVYDAGTFVMDAKKPTIIQPKVLGGKPPYRFSLPVQHPAIDLDPATGKLTIKPENLKLEQVATEYLSNNRMNRGTQAPASAAEAAERVMGNLGPRFKKLVGRDPKGLPVAVQFAINAADAEQQTTSLEFAIFVEIPTETLVKKLADAEAERTRSLTPTQQAYQRLAEGGGPTTRPTTRPSDDGSSEALRARITELENRNRQLEAQVEVLKELLGSQRTTGTGSRPQTRPR